MTKTPRTRQVRPQTEVTTEEDWRCAALIERETGIPKLCPSPQELGVPVALGHGINGPEPECVPARHVCEFREDDGDVESRPSSEEHRRYTVPKSLEIARVDEPQWP